MKEQETKIIETIKNLAKKLPKFPDGRINYHNAEKAAVLTCFVKFKDKILILKRSDKVWTYKGKWNTVAGYLDDFKPIRQKALEELNEETGIQEKDILKIEICEPFEFIDEKIKRTWLVHPLLAELKQKPEIKLDFEHTEFKWISPEEIKDFDIVPDMAKGLKRVLKS